MPAPRLRTVLPLLAILNPAIPSRTLAARLQEMRRRGYRCAGAYRGAALVGIAGVWVLCKAYVGRHAEVDNVVIDPSERGGGVGRQLIRWIEAWARARRCLSVELNCYRTNVRGQQFWEREGYQALGVHYQKRWSSNPSR